MKNRRTFLKNTILGSLALGYTGAYLYGGLHPENPMIVPETYNPWIELSRSAYLRNAKLISEKANGRGILAVLKNNAYGLGDVEVAQILDESPFVHGFALVNDRRCLALRTNGVKKAILLMGDFDQGLGLQLVQNNITLSAFSMESTEKIIRLASTYSGQVLVELYLDTGLGRMGMPYGKGVEWVKKLSNIPNIRIAGMYSTLTTPEDFAKEQISRFQGVVRQLKEMDINIPKYHIAPSLSMLQLPESHFSVVRPGILLHGSHPLVDMKATDTLALQPTYRLRARVIRMEKLKKGDTIGFSRFYKLENDEWIATLPIGWADGYFSGAENGAKVLVNNQLFKVVNVNASHCNLSIGSEKSVEVGDVATLIGPDEPEITPEGFSKRSKGHNYLQILYKESIPKMISDAF